jgi:hypothetical protein
MMMNDLGTKALVIIEPASEASKAVWRRVGLVPIDLGDPRRMGHRRCRRGPVARRGGTDSERERSWRRCPPQPTVGDLSVRPRGRRVERMDTRYQVDFTNRLASRWQGLGAIIPGVAWIGDQGLHWCREGDRGAGGHSSCARGTSSGFKSARSESDRPGWSSRRANTVKPGCCSTGAMSRHSSRD